MARTEFPVDYAYWTNISVTPNDFKLSAGQFGLLLKATWGGGNATLQRLMPDGNYYPVAAAVTADGYVVLFLPAGQYRLAITTATALTGSIELITPGRR